MDTYKIVEAFDISELENEVRSLISSGLFPIGGITITTGKRGHYRGPIYLQAMAYNRGLM